MVIMMQEALVLPHLFQIYLQLVAVVEQRKVHHLLLEVQVVAVLIVMLDLLEIHPQQVLLKDLLEEVFQVQVHLDIKPLVVEVLQKLVNQSLLQLLLSREQVVMEGQHVFQPVQQLMVAAEVAAEVMPHQLLLVQVALAVEEQVLLLLLVTLELLEQLTLVVAVEVVISIAGKVEQVVQV